MSFPFPVTDQGFRQTAMLRIRGYRFPSLRRTICTSPHGARSMPGSVIQTALRLPAVHRYAAVPGPFKEQELRSGGVAFEETLQIAVREHLIPDQASGAPSFRSAWLACMKRPQRHSSVIPPGIMKSTTPGSAPAFFLASNSARYSARSSCTIPRRGFR